MLERDNVTEVSTHRPSNQLSWCVSSICQIMPLQVENKCCKIITSITCGNAVNLVEAKDEYYPHAQLGQSDRPTLQQMVYTWDIRIDLLK